MKPVSAALAAAMLLWPLCAHAQGYAGVMAPQPGYHPPAATSRPLPSAPASGGGIGSPYSGTGASEATGYASMMNGDTGTGGQDADMAVQDAPQDLPDAQRTGSAYQRLFAPRDQDDPEAGQGGVSIYDTVNDNSMSATERRRQAIMRKINADEKKAQHDIDLANQARDEQQKKLVKKSMRDLWKKDHPDDDSQDDDGDSADDTADQGDAAGQ